jgi:hypothetical protein
VLALVVSGQPVTSRAGSNRRGPAVAVRETDCVVIATEAEATEPSLKGRRRLVNER